MKYLRVLLLVCAVLVLSTQAYCGKVEVSAPAGFSWDRVVNLEVQDRTLVDTLTMLLKDTDTDCKVAPQIASLKVRSSLQNTSISAAFAEVLNAAHAQSTIRGKTVYVYRQGGLPKTEDVLRFEGKIRSLNTKLEVAKGNKSPDEVEIKRLEADLADHEKQLWDRCWQQIITEPGQANADVKVSRDLGNDLQTQVFTVSFLDPNELVRTLQMSGIGCQVSVADGGKLMVFGTQYHLKRVAKLIAELDRETALPRPVKVQITATYTITDKAGKKEVLKGVTEGSVPEGLPLTLSIASEPMGKTVIEEDPLILTVGLARGLEQGERVSLEGNLDLKMSVIHSDDTPKHVLTVTSAPIAVSAIAGTKPITIGSGTFGRPGGKVDFVVTATVTFGEGRLRPTTNRFGQYGYGGYGGGYGAYGGTPAAPKPATAKEGDTAKQAPTETPGSSDATSKDAEKTAAPDAGGSK